jgi:hypothetical protein
MRALGIDTIVSEIMTEHGLCLTFNLAKIEDVYDVDRISADFYHEYFAINIDPSYLVQIVPRKVKTNSGFSLSAAAFQNFYDEIFNSQYDGHLIYIHSPYELPTTLSNPIFLQKDIYLKGWMEPQLNVIDESLEDMEIQE